MQHGSVEKPSGIVGLGHRSDARLLTDDEIRFEIDMCVGCDRCMRACPIPLSTQVHIADLNRATISDEVPEHVARFTNECVMCGSCVPVCPVDNHRDLLMLSLKKRLGIVWDGSVDLERILSFLPAGWDLKLLFARLREQPMFSDPQLVPEQYLRHLVVSSKLLICQPGETIMHEGAYGRELYVILEGRFELSARGQAGERLPIAILRRGEYMGERGLLTGQPRNAEARAQSAAIVLEIPEQVIQRLAELVPAIGAFFEQLNNARSIEAILKRMALFQGIAEANLRALAEQVKVRRYEREEKLFEESKGEGRALLHIVLEGFVSVARHDGRGGQERIIAYRQGGDYFAGGLDLLGDGGAVAVSAITRVSVAEVPHATLQGLFARYPEIAQRFSQRLRQYRDSAAAARSGIFDPLAHTTTSVVPAKPASEREARAGLRELVAGGVVEGTEVLVIDLDKCVHCNECEDACARRHGHSRMNRKGLVVGNISIATACRQCQDPVCLLCSRAGIIRLPSGEVTITESCIGCGICAERCPYDNISIMTLEETATTENSAWQNFSSFFKNGAGRERGHRLLPMLTPEAAAPRDAFGEIRKKLAVKCDLCAGYDNQACVQACPTGAAIRVQPAAFFGSTEEILSRKAL